MTTPNFDEELNMGDEAAALLFEDGDDALPGARRGRRALLAAAALTSLALVGGGAASALGYASSGGSVRAGVPLAVGGFEGIQGKAVHPGAVTPEEAQQRQDSRKKLGIEKDLSSVMTALDLPRGAAPGPGNPPEKAAGQLFDHVIEKHGLSWELTRHEHDAFKGRFVSAMTFDAKEEQERVSLEEFISSASVALESQKPVLTQAVVNGINAAGLGFQAKMQSWMVHESVANFQSRLGRTPLPEEKARELKNQKLDRDIVPGDPLPVSFDSREAWPECASVIGRIHNQGHCGSCWVFGALGPLDSRLCIKTINASASFDTELSMLSRGFAASCASTSDGCMGGWEYYVYEYVEQSVGIPSTACSPYFAEGPGSEHFESNGVSPPCPESCDPRFPDPLSSSVFKPSGVGASYKLVVGPNATDLEIFKRAMYEGGPVAFGIYASRPFMGYSEGIFALDCGYSANHAVHAIGWGEGYFLGQNSWGPDWGDEGRFRVAPCVPTDFTIPGDITAANYPLPIPTNTRTTTSTTPPPAPDPATIACKTDEDGCITSPNWPGEYDSSVECIISYTFGKINVIAFDVEYQYDFMTVNDQQYTGTTGPQDVVPYTNIVWKPDYSVSGPGWKICPAKNDDSSESSGDDTEGGDDDTGSDDDEGSDVDEGTTTGEEGDASESADDNEGGDESGGGDESEE